MTMSSHVINVSKSVTFHLRNIARIRKYIDQSTCHHAVRSLILSRLDYCNGDAAMKNSVLLSFNDSLFAVIQFLANEQV